MLDQRVPHPPRGMVSSGKDTKIVQQKSTGARRCRPVPGSDERSLPRRGITAIITHKSNYYELENVNTGSMMMTNYINIKLCMSTYTHYHQNLNA